MMPEKDFGWALQQLRTGKRVQREGWNGKGMWITLVLADCWQADIVHFTVLDPEEKAVKIPTLPWIGMKTADDKFVPWLASQTDVLATDWRTVE